MRDGVGLLVEAAAVASMAATASSFFGGGKKKKHQITAAENRHMYEQSAIKSVNFTLQAIKRQIEKHTQAYQVAAEVDRIFPTDYNAAIAKSLKSYTATFGASQAKTAVANLSSWIKPIYKEAQGIVEAMKKERLAQIEAPARAAQAAAQALEAETRFAQTIARAIAPRSNMAAARASAPPLPMSTNSLVIAGLALGGLWLLMKGKK